jgi:DNA-directed RNA polymerase specialized sigma24 family protein
MGQLGDALAKLDAEERALLDLSTRRAMSDDEIAEVLRAEPDEVGLRRTEIFDRLARELGIEPEDRDGRDELFATLFDVPPAG